MIRIQSFTFNPFAENTYVVSDDTGACVVIDPGCYEPAEQDALRAYVADQQLTVEYLLNTHCHIDHVLGNAFVKSTYGVPLLLHADDEPVLRAVKTYAPSYGFPRYAEATPDGYINPGEPLRFGETTFDVLFVPGHAPGHVAFYHADAQACLAGDVLFRESVGRTDLPGGHPETLLRSIRERMYALPDKTTVYPGHGPTTTIGHEKKYNPFCAA